MRKGAVGDQCLGVFGKISGQVCDELKLRVTICLPLYLTWICYRNWQPASLSLADSALSLAPFDLAILAGAGYAGS